jgi:hypothetical protein
MTHHLCRFIFTLFMLLASHLAAASEERPVSLSYDPDQDHLSFQAHDVSLKALLTLIALKTGVDIGLDPLAERSVTMQVESLPLERALKNLLRGSNTAFRYSSNKEADGSLSLLGVQVLAPGSKPSAAERLVELKGEAVLRGRQQYDAAGKNDGKRRRAQERWQERLAELPEAQQNEIVEHARQRVERYKAKREADIKQREEKKARVQQRRADAQERRYEGMSPEEREAAIALKKQRQEIIRQRYLENQSAQ